MSFRLVEVDNEGFKYLDTAGTATNLGTEATLQALDAKLATIDSVLDALLVDTGQIETLLGTIDADTSNLDVLLSTRATEATLATRLTQATGADIQAVLEAVRDTAGVKKITDPVVLGASSASVGTVKIEDGSGSGKTVAIDGSNRLAVSANVVVPPTSVSVNVSATSSLTGSSDTVYVIPSGKQLTISRFAGGSEGNSGKVSKISLFYDPAGNGTGMTLIRVMYLGTSNWEFSLDQVYTGDGTISIRMRRERLDGSADEVSGFWDGFRDA